ncbi:hypothetical protein NNRS527_00616 [Nitrosospira sp. NRS527]|nr:hypothetical protein NNRS527_00616 [Nitrosospira sp. NRS527]
MGLVWVRIGPALNSTSTASGKQTGGVMLKSFNGHLRQERFHAQWLLSLGNAKRRIDKVVTWRAPLCLQGQRWRNSPAGRGNRGSSRIPMELNFPLLSGRGSGAGQTYRQFAATGTKIWIKTITI